MALRDQIARMRNRVAEAEIAANLAAPEEQSAILPALFIDVEFQNTVQKNAADTVFQTNTAIKLVSGLGDEWQTYAKLKEPTRWFSICNLVANVDVTVTVENEESASATNIAKLEVLPVLEEWDPTTLTWNNRPVDLGDIQSVNHSASIGTGGFVNNGTSDTYEYTSPETNLTTFYGYNGYRIDDDATVADPDTKTIYGIVVRPSVTNTLSNTLTGTVQVLDVGLV